MSTIYFIFIFILIIVRARFILECNKVHSDSSLIVKKKKKLQNSFERKSFFSFLFSLTPYDILHKLSVYVFPAIFMQGPSFLLPTRGMTDDPKIEAEPGPVGDGGGAIVRFAKNRSSDGLIRARLFVGIGGRSGARVVAKTVLSYSKRLELPEVGTSSSAKGE